MRSLHRPPTLLHACSLVLLALVVGACDTDSPTAPQPAPPATPPGSGTASAVWNITLSAVDSVEISGQPVTVQIDVQVRRASNNQPPPEGSTLVLSTSFGTLTDSEGLTGTSIPILLNLNGFGQALLSAAGTEELSIVVQAQLEDSFAQKIIELTTLGSQQEPFLLETITPTAGPPGGGTFVSIFGSGFDAPVRVLFGTLVATVIAVDANQIVVQTPPVELPVNQTQTVNVSVTINFNDPGEDQTSQTDTLPSAFTYARGAGDSGPLVPRIFTITPTSGPNEGGTQVTIRGEGFDDDVQVFFGTATLVAAPVLDVSPDRIVVTTPAAIGVNSSNQNSLVDVRVVNVGTGFEDTLALSFQYGNPDSAGAVAITAIGPSEAPYLGGDLVTLFGRGFEEPVAVGLAGIGQEIISVTGTEIIVRTPRVRIVNCSDVSGPSAVTNVETGEGATGPGFTFRALSPVIFDIIPALSPEAGGGPFTITGGNFFSPLRVIFAFDNGDVAAPGVTVVDAGTITGTVPAFSGMFDTEECDDSPGDGQTGERFIPTRVSVRVINLETGCEDEFDNAFTFEPDDMTCRDDDAPPPPPPPIVPPSANFAFNIAGTVVTFINLTTGDAPISYQWILGDGNTSTLINPVHDYMMSGTFTVTLIATNPAGNSSISMDVVIP